MTHQSAPLSYICNISKWLRDPCLRLVGICHGLKTKYFWIIVTPLRSLLLKRSNKFSSINDKEKLIFDTTKQYTAKGTFQKLLSGFCPLRGGGTPPFR